MADSVAQTKLDEITLEKIQGDVIRSCIERLNNAIQHEEGSALYANMKAVTASVGRLYDIELATALSEIAERISGLKLREYQKELLFNGGGNLFFWLYFGFAETKRTRNLPS